MAHKTKCRCGWAMPKKVLFAVDDEKVAEAMRLYSDHVLAIITCPECGLQYESTNDGWSSEDVPS